jgi:phospholipid N-methyltransferase
MSSFLYFLKAALKSPLQTSTPFQTGPRVAERFGRHIALRPGEILVELGVGAGAITKHLLPKLRDPKSYVGFELNEDLHKFLSKEYPHLEIHQASAENISQFVGGRKVGAVVSTLPWSLLGPEVRGRILEEIYQVLIPGGIFATFLAMHVAKTDAGKDFRAQMEKFFPEVQEEIEFMNFPPCRVLVAKKN